mgnify:CR=1 FL=1
MQDQSVMDLMDLLKIRIHVNRANLKQNRIYQFRHDAGVSGASKLA